MDPGISGARIRLAGFALAIVLCIGPPSQLRCYGGQGPLALAAPQQTTAPSGNGVIAGTLTSADLGRPVRRAQVKIVRASPRLIRTVTTNANGAYLFTNVAAGEYTLSASKPGYLETVFGARRPGAGMPGTPILLSAGEKRDQLALRIPRGGVISGVITDEFGDPALGVMVRAMRFTFTNGARTASAAGNVLTNDLGEYRIPGLMPGDYVVSAVPRDIVAAAAGEAESLRNRMAQVAAAGGTRDNVTPDVLFPSDRAQWLPQSRRIHVAQPAADGRYAIRGLPPGEYRLAAVDAPEPGQAFDPAFLSPLASAAVTIKLGPGERLTHDLRVR